MKICARSLLVSLLLGLVAAQSARAQIDARMLQNPDVSADRIVFAYAGDLWVVPKDGGTAHRLSSPPGQELFPHFSPDGSKIAYSADYDGNLDVYVIPAGGGLPARVTNHGMADRMIDWTPDGIKLLFASSMNSGRQRYNQFYEIAPTGGLPEQLPIPYGEFASFSPDGKKVAYTPISQAFRTWKRYRGGMAADIWVFDLTTGSAENITNDPANDEFPMWAGNKLYYLSDRGPEQRSNIWVYDFGTKQSTQLTKFTDFDVHFPALGPSDVVFEAGGVLYLLSLGDQTNREIPITVVTDDLTLLTRREKVGELIQSISLAPDGKRALFGARGDVFSVPAENGPVIDLTGTSGTAERYPAWSPDGKRTAYWSDASGEYELTLRELARPGSEKKLTSYGPGFRYELFWSPNSKLLAFVDKAMEIKIYDVDNGTTTAVDKNQFMYEGDLEGFSMAWSPDSRWLAYRKEMIRGSSAIALFDVKSGVKHQVTSGYYNDSAPSFDPDGKYLYFLTSRDFHPIYSDVDNSFIYANSTRIAAATLNEKVLSPLAPKNDSTLVASNADTGSAASKDKGKAKGKKDKNAESKPVNITVDGFEGRVVLLPPKAGNYAALQGVSGKVVYRKGPETGSPDENHPVMFYDLDKREEKTIVDNSDVFEVSADGKKVLVGKDGTYSVVEVADGQKLDKKMPTGDMEMMVDPRAEWKQIMNDVWRFERDFFYDPNLHGVNWAALRTRYGKLLDAAVTRWDVNFVIGELISELSSSHTYRGGGDTEAAKDVAVGYLGVDWEKTGGAYRIKKIIRGAPWDAEVRSPLDEPGIAVKEGTYVLAVNGKSLDPNQAPWGAFAGLAGKSVVLTVNDRPTPAGARDVLIETLKTETRLRNLAWIEGNRHRVDEATGGKIGYIYVPSTDQEGQTELVRQFAAQFDKQGLIVDERFNSGGQIPDRFIELLDRKPLAFWAVRDGKNWQWPPSANFGPKVMLINGWSGSGGDAFPDYFRKAGLGPLIGMRTWGGLIGISGAPGLIDGGQVTVPTFRMYNPDGTWFKEGHGVDPDIEVPEDPAKLAKGIDVQLERGIQEVMKLLAEHPGVSWKQPAYQTR
jgi:tricorn protease